MKTLYVATAAAIAVLSSPASAATTVSGSSNGLDWTASSNIIGMTSTGTVASGGSPIYLAPNSAGYSGVVGLLMQYSNGSGFVCSGSLIGGNRIVTAAHCVSDGAASNINGRAAGLVSTTAFFYSDAASIADNPIYSGGPGVFTVDVSDYFVNDKYTGEVIDQNDIAVLQLRGSAPTGAQVYDLYTGGDLTGEQFNVAGFGQRSAVGGALGTSPDFALGTGRRRQGDNIYDYAWGNSAFGGFFTDRDENGENFFGTADIEFSFVSDSDNGLAANDTACRIAQAVGAGTQFCQTGVGALEVNIGGGDSGGPGFIDGKLASVNSYSLSFGTNFGDFNCIPATATAPQNCLNNSWGEFDGYVPTYIHAAWIAGVPEPSTWAMFILGFGLLGSSLRRRNRVALAHAF